MKNYHTVILGKTGFGKTSFARMMAAVCRRLFVFDLTDDAIWDNIKITLRDPVEAARYFARRREGNFQATLRFDDGETYFKFLQGIYQYQNTEDLPPLAIFIEESSLFSDSYNIKEELENIVTKGRRARISLVSIAQESTQLNPTIRRQSFVTVLFHMKEMSAKLGEQIRRSGVPDPASLSALDPFTSPVYGEHFVTLPPGENPFRGLATAMLHDGDPSLPEDYRPPI